MDVYDPYRAERRATGACPITVDGEELVAVLRHRDVRRLARSWDMFSSDAPFRVPIPVEHEVRSVRQLPIETDPPDHRDYRRIVREPFSQTTAAAIQDAFAAFVDTQVSLLLRGPRELVREVAIPLQSHALGLMMRRPDEDVQRWISWGTHVFRDIDSTDGHRSDLDAYLAGRLDAAVDNPAGDFFGVLARGRFHGRALSRDEMLGFANLAFAGGRDTLINLILHGVHTLAVVPSALARLRADETMARLATEELLRYFSPLPHLARVATQDTRVCAVPVAADQRVALVFASANRDEDAFDDPDRLILDRFPNRHVAFGSGPHTCLGAPLTRMVMRTLLHRLATRIDELHILEEAPHHHRVGPFVRHGGFERLVIEARPRH